MVVEKAEGCVVVATTDDDVEVFPQTKAEGLGIWCEELHRDLPKKWEKHGDLIVFPQRSFQNPKWRIMGRDLWRLVAESLKIKRLGRKRLIDDDITRTPHVDILFGTHGWVEHIDEHGIRYVYDVSKRVFNIVNVKEMERIAKLDCHQEHVLDLCSGIGYFTLPFLMKAKAKHVTAIDWDEDMIEAIRRSVSANNCEDRSAPVGVADRVYLSYTPSSRPYWLTACKALRGGVGVLYLHETVRLSSAPTLKKSPIELPQRLKSEKKVEKLESVDEESSCASIDSGLPRSPSAETKEETKTTKKFSRSASILEELESIVHPDPRVEKTFEEEIWPKLDASYREFAIDAATQCTRFLNNLYGDGTTQWVVTVTSVVKIRQYAPHTDHVVVDLLCSTESVPQKKTKSKSPSPPSLSRESSPMPPLAGEEQEEHEE